MAKAKAKKPFTTKGIKVVSPKGQALWCKATEADYEYNDKGVYSTSLVCDPNDPTVQAFISKLEALRDEAEEQTRESLGAKAKNLDIVPVYTEEFDSEGEPTGNIIFKFKLPNVDDREKGQDQVKFIDANKAKIKFEDMPNVGNGSTIRCRGYFYPYFMAGTPARNIPPCLGITNIWEVMQLIELEEYSGGDVDGFDDEDGYTANGDDSASGFDDTSDDQVDDDGDY